MSHMSIGSYTVDSIATREGLQSYFKATGTDVVITAEEEANWRQIATSVIQERAAEAAQKRFSSTAASSEANFQLTSKESEALDGLAKSLESVTGKLQALAMHGPLMFSKNAHARQSALKALSHPPAPKHAAPKHVAPVKPPTNQIRCAYAHCAMALGADAAQTARKCSKCANVLYCNRKCERADLANHKPSCKA